MIYFVFFSVNVLCYFGLTNLQNFLAIVKRLSSVFEMQEFERRRDTRLPSSEAMVEMENVTLSWGFRVKEN